MLPVALMLTSPDCAVNANAVAETTLGVLTPIPAHTLPAVLISPDPVA